MKKAWNYIFLTMIVIAMGSWFFYPNIWGVRAFFGFLWVGFGLLVSLLLWRISENRRKGLDADIGGGRLRSHDMGSQHYPLWFLRWQGDTWLSMFLSTLIFTFLFFLLGSWWWTSDWNARATLLIVVGIFASMIKALAFWVPGTGEKYYEMSKSTRDVLAPDGKGSFNKISEQTGIRPNSFRYLLLIFLATLKGHKEAKKCIFRFFCQGGTQRISSGESLKIPLFGDGNKDKSKE